jgi:uroporphyrinogen decarboxylase
MNSLMLDALHCRNTARPPVWLMRQAGRYMPQYRALREKHTLWQLFHEPELAAQVTLLPIDLLGVDAAILFSDILVIAELLGLSVQFPEKGGPRVEPAIRTPEAVDQLPILHVDEVLAYVTKTIRLLKPTLKVPLLGFCGGPFTVASYFIDSGSKQEFEHTKAWMERDPASFHRLLEKLTQASIAYLLAQVEAGVNAVQIFDSWASILTYSQFQAFCLPYLKRMVEALKSTGAPVIVFCRNSSLYPAELTSLEPRCISFDWHRPMHELRHSVPPEIAIQGNIDPTFLKNPKSQITEAVRALVSSMQGDPGFIVNLGHGVLPDIPMEHVQCFVDAVKSG